LATLFPRLWQVIHTAAHHTRDVRSCIHADVTGPAHTPNLGTEDTGCPACCACDPDRVRTVIALICLLGGAWLAAYAWLPTAAQLPLPELVLGWALPLGLALVVIGVLLVRGKAAKPALGDGPLVSTLTQAGFRIDPGPQGWKADGSWKGVPLVVRKSTGHAAGRFGRPWTIVVALPGQPIEPWPFLPEEGLIVDHRDDGFSVAMADLSRPERMHRLGERLDQLVRNRN
jgi:hypothetical protein